MHSSASRLTIWRKFANLLNTDFGIVFNISPPWGVIKNSIRGIIDTIRLWCSQISPFSRRFKRWSIRFRMTLDLAWAKQDVYMVAGENPRQLLVASFHHLANQPLKGGKSETTFRLPEQRLQQNIQVRDGEISAYSQPSSKLRYIKDLFRIWY